MQLVGLWDGEGGGDDEGGGGGADDEGGGGGGAGADEVGVCGLGLCLCLCMGFGDGDIVDGDADGVVAGDDIVWCAFAAGSLADELDDEQPAAPSAASSASTTSARVSRNDMTGDLAAIDTVPAAAGCTAMSTQTMALRFAAAR